MGLIMASIVISFVGMQDPVSDNTREDGSIVTLVKHLMEQPNQIARIVLLHTQGTAERAEMTKGWLSDEPFCLLPETIETIAVSEALSTDPVNLLLAAQEARKGIETVLPQLSKQDTLEFNASSGTPVMKGSWSILQAAGYAPNSRVWQVRNPKEMQSGQTRVFQTNVDTLRHEFEIKVAKQQINDYNYSGAAITLRASGLTNPVIDGLLEYGRCRLALDYSQADSALQPIKSQVDPYWLKQIAKLRQRDLAALAQEAYLNGLTKLNNRQFSEFLERLSSFHEVALRAVLQKNLPIEIRASKHRRTEAIWQDLQRVDGGKLYQHLQTYHIPNKSGDNQLHLKGFITPVVMVAILSYYDSQTEVQLSLKLQQYIHDRNDLVHGLEGVSQIDDEQEILNTMKQLLKRVITVASGNPFDVLNQQLCELLDRSLRPIAQP